MRKSLWGFLSPPVTRTRVPPAGGPCMSAAASTALAARLAAARAGSNEALGQSLEPFRRYLLEVARQAVGPALRAKGGASDLVQETFLEAQQLFPRFDGKS